MDAVVGGALVSVSGGNAKAGAAGAAAGELAADVAAHVMADGKYTSELTQSEREQISQWGQIAGGVAGGLAGGGKNHAAEIGAGAQAGKNAVENNLLTLPKMKQVVDELADCIADYGCSMPKVTAKWMKTGLEQELEYQKGNFSAPKEYVKDIAIPVWEAATHPVDTAGNAWTYTTDALLHPIENWDKLSTFKFVIAPSELITKPIQTRVENIGRYYLGNGGKEASYNAGVESGKLAIDVGSLFIGVGEVGGLRAGVSGAEKAASAAERVGLESVETATNVAKAARMAAEASIATDSSPKITTTETETVKLLFEKEALERIKENTKNLSEKSENDIYHRQLIKNAESVPSTAKNSQSEYPRDINEKILFQSVESDPAGGNPLFGLNSDPRFPIKAGFQKMEIKHEMPDGGIIVIHYQYNRLSGKAYDIKVTSKPQSILQPGPSIYN